MIRILIADDHAIVRAGLRQFIADQVDMEVTAEAASGSETVSAVRAADFDVVLLDISMPDKNGIDTLRLLRSMGVDEVQGYLIGRPSSDWAIDEQMQKLLS